MEPLKEFSSTKLTLYNCVIPEDRLRNTPSSKDGMCHDTEIDLRMKGCECIQSAGLLLKLPQVCNCKKLIFTNMGINWNSYYHVRLLSLYCSLFISQAAMATAQVLFHRFYYAKSFVKFNFYVSPFCVNANYYYHDIRWLINRFKK